MYGAIIGDIAGSRFEFNNFRSKKFEIFHPECEFTDDSVMSIALAGAILDCDMDYSNLNEKSKLWMQDLGHKYPNRGYGGKFYQWLFFKGKDEPYNSFGNGSAMRVSSAGWAGNTLDEVKEISKKITEVTHNHPEGIKGAEAVATSIFLARSGKSKEEIRKYIEDNYYKIDFTIDEIRPTYMFNEICQDTVPQSLEVFFESTSFEDAIRLAISLGGDSDTIGAIVGSIAEAYYGIPEDMVKSAKSYLDDYLIGIIENFEDKFGNNVIK